MGWFSDIIDAVTGGFGIGDVLDAGADIGLGDVLDAGADIGLGDVLDTGLDVGLDDTLGAGLGEVLTSQDPTSWRDIASSVGDSAFDGLSDALTSTADYAPTLDYFTNGASNDVGSLLALDQGTSGGEAFNNAFNTSKGALSQYMSGDNTPINTLSDLTDVNPVRYTALADKLLSGNAQVPMGVDLSNQVNIDAIVGNPGRSSIVDPSAYTLGSDTYTPTDMSTYDANTDTFAGSSNVNLDDADRAATNAMYKANGDSKTLLQKLLGSGTQGGTDAKTAALMKALGLAVPSNKSNLASGIGAALLAAQVAGALKGNSSKSTPTITQTQRAATPMTWVTPKNKASGGEIQGNGPQGALGLLRGSSTGQRDDVPINASHGEYMFDADTVSALGDGNTNAGAAKLDKMRENIRAHKRSAPASKIPPKAKSLQAYLQGSR